MLYLLLIKLRALQLSAHFYHNVCAGESFFQDHAYFAGAYEKAEEDYDSIIERMIGIHEQVPSLTQILVDVALEVGEVSEEADNETYFQDLLERKQNLIDEINRLADEQGHEMSEGVIQLIGNIADSEEVEVYKIKQRLK